MSVRIALALVALLGGTGVVMADSKPDKVAVMAAVSSEQITSRLQSQGFRVTKIEMDDGRYKVKATDAAGRKQKLYVSPSTGEVVSKGDDDD